MARVPVNVPQVGQTAAQLPGFQAPSLQPAQNFAPQGIAALGQGLSQLGESASRIGMGQQRQIEQDQAEQERQTRIAAAEQEQAKRDQERIQREQDRLDETAATDARNKWMMFGKQKASDFSKLEGAAPAQSIKAFLDDMEKERKKFSDSLASDSQRKIFAGSTDLLMADFKIGMDTHAFKENRNYQRTTFGASAALNVDSYINSYVDSVNRVEQIGTGGVSPFGPYADKYRISPAAYRAAMESDIAKMMAGEPQEAIQVAIQKAATGMHSGVLARLVEANLTGKIPDYISSNRSEISDSDAARYTEIASRTKETENNISAAISIANKYRERSGYFSDSDFSDAMRQLDALRMDPNSGIDDNKYSKLRSALNTIKENDAGARHKIEAGIKMEAADAIRNLTTPQAREEAIVSGISGSPIRYAITDQESSEAVFALSNKELYQKIVDIGALDDLRAMLGKAKPQDDESALAEITESENLQSDYWSRKSEDEFVSQYALRLSPDTLNKFVQKIRSEQANTPDYTKRDIDRSRTNILIGNGMLTSDGKFDESKKPFPDSFHPDVASQSAKYQAFLLDIENGYEEYTRKIQKKPNVEDYESYLKNQFDLMKRTGISKPTAAYDVSDEEKIPISITLSNGRQVSTVLADIDRRFRDDAIEYLKRKNTGYVVSIDGQMVDVFDTIDSAKRFASANSNRGNVTIARPQNSDVYDPVAVGQKSLELATLEGVEPDIATRNSRVEMWAKSQELKDSVRTPFDTALDIGEVFGVPGSKQGSIARSITREYESVKKVKEALSIAEMLNSGNYDPSMKISPDMLVAVTGLSESAAQRKGIKIRAASATSDTGGVVVVDNSYYKAGDIAKFATDDVIGVLKSSLEDIKKKQAK